MTKQVFLNELQTRLSGLPQEDLEEHLNFYSEIIDDKTEEGHPEEEAVAEIGSIDDVVSQILAGYPLAKIVKEKSRPKHSLRVWEIVLLVLGSPIWLTLLIAALAVVLSVYIVIWAVVISLCAVDIAIALYSLFEIIMAVIFASQGNIPTGIAALGVGIFGIGCSVLLFFGSKAAAKAGIMLTKKILLGIKAMLIGKERSK